MHEDLTGHRCERAARCASRCAARNGRGGGGGSFGNTGRRCAEAAQRTSSDTRDRAFDERILERVARGEAAANGSEASRCASPQETAAKQRPERAPADRGECSRQDDVEGAVVVRRVGVDVVERGGRRAGGCSSLDLLLKPDVNSLPALRRRLVGDIDQFRDLCRRGRGSDDVAADRQLIVCVRPCLKVQCLEGGVTGQCQDRRGLGILKQRIKRAERASLKRRKAASLVGQYARPHVRKAGLQLRYQFRRKRGRGVRHRDFRRRQAADRLRYRLRYRRHLLRYRRHKRLLYRRHLLRYRRHKRLLYRRHLLHERLRYRRHKRLLYRRQRLHERLRYWRHKRLHERLLYRLHEQLLYRCHRLRELGHKRLHKRLRELGHKWRHKRLDERLHERLLYRLQELRYKRRHERLYRRGRLVHRDGVGAEHRKAAEIRFVGVEHAFVKPHQPFPSSNG